MVNTGNIPYNLEAETACLGSILMKNNLADLVFTKINNNDFFDGRNKIIAETISNHLKKNVHEPIDIITLTDELKASNKLHQAGGVEYISNIIDSIPTTSNAEYYAEMVKEKSILRQVIECGNQIIAFGHDSEISVSETLDRSQQLLFNITRSHYSDYKKLKFVLEDAINKLEANYKNKGKSIGIESGFRDFDNMIGGFHGSNLIVIGGRTATGKSALAINIMENIAIRSDEKTGVGFFTLEMSKAEVCMRILCSQARIPSEKFLKNTLVEGDWSRIVNAANNMVDAPIFIDDTPSLSLYELSTKVRRMVKEDVRLIIVDYLQLMGPYDTKIPREQHIASISKGLKRLARELDIPVIALTQLNRLPETRDNKRPFLSDIRESGSIEQDADIVCFIHHQSIYEPDNEEYKNKAEIIVAKNRHGKTGKIDMSFFGPYTRFENFARAEE